MIRHLTIRHFALADQLAIDFRTGLTILTGETGAGKSILVGAMAAVLGGRVFSEVVRTGFEKALVEAVVDLAAVPALRPILEEKGIPLEGEELFLRREIAAKGSSRAFINDVPVTIGTLAEVGDYLVDIHGQHEHQRLLHRETHLGLLDALGRLDGDRGVVAGLYDSLRTAEADLSRLAERQRTLDSQHELLEFQFNEIEQARLQPDEEDDLLAERRLLANTEKLSELARVLSELFGGDGDFNLLAASQEAEDRLRELSRYATDLERLHQEFTSARIVMDETARSIEEFGSRLEFDPERLEAVEARLDLINRLKKKYGESVAAILARQAEIAATLELRTNFEHELERLCAARDEGARRYGEAALALSERRREVAAAMESRVQEELATLGMPRMRFQVRLEREADDNGPVAHDGQRFGGDATGIDQVEFFISPNPGEDFKPLGKIASGGEISRIMLAIKTILAGIDAVPTMVFDEIDSGVSGRIAQAVGRSIRGLARRHQIFCITHLPQIASQGDSHFAVEKYVEDGRTFTRIRPLEGEERVEAVARLIAGDHLSDTVLDSARQLMREAGEDETGVTRG